MVEKALAQPGGAAMRYPILISIILLLTALIAKADDSLVLYLPFDEVDGQIVRDVSRYGNDGELKGGAELVDGRIGKAVSLNGVDAYVEVLDNDIFAGTVVTLEAWFRTESSENFPIIWKEKTAGGGSYWVRVEPPNNRIRCLFRDKQDTVAIPVAGSPYNDGDWHHMAATLGDNVARLYIDGNLENEVASNVGEFDSVMNMGIGVRYLDNLDTFSEGSIDEVRVWNRALSQDEIKANMNKGKEHFTSVSHSGKLAALWGTIKTRQMR
jgi:hypothetical protein